MFIKQAMDSCKRNLKKICTFVHVGYKMNGLHQTITFLIQVPGHTRYTSLSLSLCLSLSYETSKNIAENCLHLERSMDWHEGKRGESKSKRVWSGNTTITNCRPTHGTMRTNPWHREEELQDIYSNKTSKRQLKHSNQLSLPRQDDCKTRNDIKYCIPKQRPTQNPPQTMGGT